MQNIFKVWLLAILTQHLASQSQLPKHVQKTIEHEEAKLPRRFQYDIPIENARVVKRSQRKITAASANSNLAFWSPKRHPIGASHVTERDPALTSAR